MYFLLPRSQVPWLRIDFDKWKEQDEEDSTDEDNAAAGAPPNISTQDWLKNKYPEAYRDRLPLRVNKKVVNAKLTPEIIEYELFTERIAIVDFSWT